MWRKLCCPPEIKTPPSKPGVLNITNHHYIWSQPRDSNNLILLMLSNYLRHSWMFISINADTSTEVVSVGGEAKRFPSQIRLLFITSGLV